MQIREAIPSDIPEIVQVLKLSLGEVDLPLSEEIWKYKHLDNPFGKSLVLIAEEDKKIIGVRAFMRWDWMIKKKILKAYRAVDTATHPRHRGKGIFKKLTLKAVELAKKKEDHFIFNTPNDQSRPGYLKMGWEKAGKIRVGIKPVPSSLFSNSVVNVEHIFNRSSGAIEIEKLCSDWNKRLELKNLFYTPKSGEFLKWRYLENPLQQYRIASNSMYYCAGYIKERKNLRELRISECIYLNEKASLKALKKEIFGWSKYLNAHFISFSPESLDLKISFTGSLGPILTIRPLTSTALADKNLFNTLNWANSLGDLELF